MPAGPAYRIETERLLLRAYEPGDAPLLKAAVDASLDDLRPWMPWAADEPQTLEEKVELCRGFRRMFDEGRDFYYGIFDPADTRLIGSTGLRLRRGAKAREIGYWIASGETGHGYALEAAAALVRVAFEVDRADRVEIRAHADNRRSLAIPRSLGFTEKALLHAASEAGSEGEEARDTIVFALLAADYPATPSAASRVFAFDAEGREIPLAG